jgi:hypothetical protein
MYFIDVPDALADKLAELPVFARSGSLERAINRALDAAGWPGILADPACNYYYVNIWNRTGELAGHVGPIAGASRAQEVARSWQKSGAIADHSRNPLGKPLTNGHRDA